MGFRQASNGDGPDRSSPDRGGPGDGVRRPVSSDVAPPTEGTVQPTGAKASEQAEQAPKSEAPPTGETHDLEATQPLSPADEPSSGK